MARGFYGIGIYHPKTEMNIGTLWRSAHLYGAHFIFTVGARYKKQPTDTTKSWLNVPLLNFTTLEDLIDHLPSATPLIGVELDDRAKPLNEFNHPRTGVYMLGAEDHGLPQHVIDRCHRLVSVPSLGFTSLNVSTAGSIVLYDRFVRGYTS